VSEHKVISDPADPLAVDDTRLLDRTWHSPRGIKNWFGNIHHKEIGRRYVKTGFALFLLAGLEALAVRLQLAVPENNLLGPELYREMFTMHGSTMMFLYAVPIMQGIGIYLVPLMIGNRELALPRLNAFGYYCYLIGAIVLYVAFLIGIAPNSGWFSYPPLTRPEHERGLNIDVYTSTVTLLEVAALVAAVGLIATILKNRAPGMSLNRMPLFVWSILVMSFMVAFAMPTLMTTSIFLALDRTVGAHFFNPAGMGDPLLWQHIFWYFGHPEVYIMFVPATGIISAVIATMTRRPVYGYTAVVLALVATGVLSFGLWVHHMFTTGLPKLGTSLFTGASMLVAIPTTVQLFCWIATLWGGRPKFTTAFYFTLGFLIIFFIGGLTGVQLGSVSFDSQVHDSFFVVAHFHYVLLGGVVFPMFAGIYYWFPKVTGRMLNETLGKLNFWLMFIGVHVTFWPQHHLGFLGMPRRVYTYVESTGWGELNLISTLGSFMIAAGVLVFLVNFIISKRAGLPAGHDPWGGDSLEWSTTSPPPSYNFRFPPTVSSVAPLWQRDWHLQPIVTGLREDHREMLSTTLLDARPDNREIIPGDTYVPLVTALAASVSFIGILFGKAFVPIGALLFYFAAVYWNWPRVLANRTEPEGGPEHQLAMRDRERRESKEDERTHGGDT
jgi:cytochrome c oxidase subunit I+III